MQKVSSRVIRPVLLGVAVLALFACGASTTVKVAGVTPSVAATATATMPPTATPTPAHMVVTIYPLCGVTTPCAPYVCHDGTTCTAHGICTASSWPPIKVSNSGQVALTWNATMDGSATPPTGWTMSPTNGTLAGGETSPSITINDNPSTMTTFPTLVIASGAQMVSFNFGCAAG